MLTRAMSFAEEEKVIYVESWDVILSYRTFQMSSLSGWVDGMLATIDCGKSLTMAIITFVFENIKCIIL